MDPLTDLFLAVHVSSVVQARIEATAPWGLAYAKPDREGAYACAHFAHVARGNCYLSLAGRDGAIPLTGGDCVLLAPNTTYALRDHPRSRAVSVYEIGRGDADGVIRLGGGGAASTIISGWFALDRASSRSFLDLLPPWILIRAEHERSVALKTTLESLSAELASPGPGSDVVLTRLADVLFIQALRAHVDSGGCTETPRWLRALADAQIGQSLRAVHAELAGPWTLATMARAAGMSRSAFAARFKTLVGETPLEYLTRWRMQTAGRLLRDRSRKLSAVARSVGYQTESAFTRAFRRVHGVGPSLYRRSAS
jgi:AraC-like DNA-binding protein